MQVEKLSGNPKPLDILAKINQIIDNMVVSVNGSGTDGNGNIDIATIPVGFNYVQYPGESAPADIFGGTWENISAQFAGMFFRAEGGNAAVFGETQTEGVPNISGEMYNVIGNTAQLYGSGAFTTSKYNSPVYDGLKVGWNAKQEFSASNSDARYAVGETRPINRTIRIWKRTA